MTLSNIRSGIFNIAQSMGNFAYNTGAQASNSFNVLSQDLKDLDTAITFAKAGDVFISAKAAFGFGQVPSCAESYQSAVGYLEGWNALMTFPDAIKETIKKVSELFVKHTCYAAIDCISMVTGCFNATCETVGFLENQLAIPCFNGISDVVKTSNFQALAVGAAARVAVASERVFSFAVGSKDVGYGEGVENGLAIAKNLGDFVFAVTILTTNSPLVMAGASSLSAASKVAMYGWSKFV